MSHDLREDLIRYRLEQADGAIQAAEALFPLALYRETISRLSVSIALLLEHPADHFPLTSIGA